MRRLVLSVLAACLASLLLVPGASAAELDPIDDVELVLEQADNTGAGIAPDVYPLIFGLDGALHGDCTASPGSVSRNGIYVRGNGSVSCGRRHEFVAATICIQMRDAGVWRDIDDECAGSPSTSTTSDSSHDDDLCTPSRRGKLYRTYTIGLAGRITDTGDFRVTHTDISNPGGASRVPCPTNLAGEDPEPF
jgi:hypothetical protein